VLIENGLKAVCFPLESGSVFVQNEIIKKKINLNTAPTILKYAHEQGLYVSINIVLGFPGETKDMILETYRYIKQLPIDWVSFFIAYPFPGTEMTCSFLDRGDLSESMLEKIWEDSPQGSMVRYFDTLEIKGKELSDIIYDFNIDLNFFNNYNLITSKNYVTMLLKLERIIARYPFHVVALACRSYCYFSLGRFNDANNDIQALHAMVNTNTESHVLYERYKNEIGKILALVKCGN